jgi:hypothetical protein
MDVRSKEMRKHVVEIEEIRKEYKASNKGIGFVMMVSYSELLKIFLPNDR